MGFQPALSSFDAFDFEFKKTTFTTHHTLMHGEKGIVIFRKNKIYEFVLLHLLYGVCFEHGETHSIHFQDSTAAV